MGYSQAQKAESRKKVVQTAARQLRENGIDALGVADCMRSAGLTQGAFYGHFASRDALIVEALKLALDESEARMASRRALPGGLKDGLPDGLSDELPDEFQPGLSVELPVGLAVETSAELSNELSGKLSAAASATAINPAVGTGPGTGLDVGPKIGQNAGTEAKAAASGETLHRIVEAYLGQQHYRNPGEGCTLCALAGEARHATPEVRALLTAHLRKAALGMAQATAGSRGEGEVGEEERNNGKLSESDTRRGLGMMALIVGAMTLARAVDDETLAESILASARELIFNEAATRNVA